MTINAQPIVAKLQPFLDGRPLWLAFSGGLDSTVLVHLLAQQQPTLPLRLIHVNHQLHPDAAQWTAHCQQFADRLHLPISILEVSVDLDIGLGLEAAARDARYGAINQLIGADGVLLTGQHQQDQAETVMLQLLRGAGNRGLAAMTFRTRWHTMNIVRPLLTIDRSALLSYANHHQLKYLNDPSNDDISIQRNFLRHQIWPLLSSRWPALNQTLSRSAAHLSEAQTLLDELAQSDLKMVNADAIAATLDCASFLTLSAARQRNLLRYFLHQLKQPLPSTAILQRIIDDVCAAKTDAMPLVQWSGIEARRFAGKLYLQAQLPSLDSHWQQKIVAPEKLLLPDGRQLKWLATDGPGLSAAIIKQGLTLRFRHGGEKIQLAGHAQHHDLKNCLQQWQVPSWQRPRIPLLFAGSELVAVSGYAVSEKAVPPTGEQGWWPFVDAVATTDF
ncbi:MAG TPA: tRNA lysidine(34) synthetase TilS [Methylophaga sp.]|nr:tRNA lysidine(34) synthetase TilS [Methylophaga sp.]